MKLSDEQLLNIQRLCRRYNVEPDFLLHRLPVILHQFNRHFGRRHFLVNSAQSLKFNSRGKYTIIWSRFKRSGLDFPPKKNVPENEPETKLRLVCMRQIGQTPRLTVLRVPKKDRCRPNSNPSVPCKATLVFTRTNEDLGTDSLNICYNNVDRPSSAIQEERPSNIFDIAMGSPLKKTNESSGEPSPDDVSILSDKSSSVSDSNIIWIDCEVINNETDHKTCTPKKALPFGRHVERRSSTPVQDELGMLDDNPPINGTSMGTGHNYRHIFDQPIAERVDSDLDSGLVIDKAINETNDTSINFTEEVNHESDQSRCPGPPDNSRVDNTSRIANNYSGNPVINTVQCARPKVIEEQSNDTNVEQDGVTTIHEYDQRCAHKVMINTVAKSLCTPYHHPDVPKTITNQLREQLSFFKMGKRKESILGEPVGGSIRVVKPGGRTTTPSLSRNTSNASIEDQLINSCQSPNSQTSLGGTIKEKFIDSLITRIKLKSGSEAIDPIPKLKPVVNTQKQPACYKQSDEESSNMSDTPDFFGFNSHETEKCPSVLAIPGLMATPVVPESSAKSAFVSEALDNFMKENALESSAALDIPMARIHDDALITHDANPPNMICPKLPQHLEKPRTLAAKREQLEGQTDINILMIENEMCVFRELKKRSRAGSSSETNNQHIRSMQEHNIPFTRDCWLATSWLATKMGRYYYQTIRTANGNQVKICSGTGNHRQKCIYEFPKCFKPVPRKSPTIHSLRGIKINNINDYIMSISPSATMTETRIGRDKTEDPPSNLNQPIKLNTLSTQRRIVTCGPLSKKQLCDQRTSLDMDLGPLQIFNMPAIHLEVWPKLEKPLPEQIRPYLKMAMPFECMTAKWVNFALTALKVPLKESYTTLSGRSIYKATYNEEKLSGPPKPVVIKCPTNESFVFDIPYANDQHRLLIRARNQLISTLNKSAFEQDMPSGVDCTMYFDRDIDPSDTIALEVAGVIRSMLYSVEISLNEETMCTEDPDAQSMDMGQLVSIERSDVSAHNLTILKGINNSQRIRKELKRLNATIIDNYDAPAKENCTEDFCKMGCVCDSMHQSRIYATTHCKKFDCMFKCSCLHKPNGLNASRNSNIEQLRTRATADLAKEEKEFRATVVLSQDRTIYIPNHENMGKRSKRVPKRFHDSLDTPFSPPDPSSNPSSSSSTSSSTRKSVPDIQSSTCASTMSDQKPMQAELNKMTNCSVPLLQMPSSLCKLEPWCLVHNLYKCFCKQRAVSGKLFTFDDTGRIQNEPDELYSPPAKKRQYTFEKNAPIEAPLQRYTSEKTAWDKGTHTSRTTPFIGRKRSQKEVRKMHEMYRQIEQDNPLLKKLLNNRKRRCWMHDEKVYTVDSDSAVDTTTVIANTTFKETTNKMKLKTRLNEKNSHKPRHALPKQIQSPTEIPIFKDKPVRTITKNPERIVGDKTTPELPVKKHPNAKHEHNTKYFNYCVNRTMEQIKNAQIETTMVKKPIPKSLNCIQWNRFVALFLANRIFVWEIRLESQEVILGVTVQQVMPLVPGAISAINIKSVRTDRLPLIGKMFKHAVFGPKTAQAALLICGVTNYWKIISVIYSDKNYMEEDHRVQPSPTSHPELAAKIANLFQMLTRNVVARSQNTDGQAATASQSQEAAKMDKKFTLPKSDLLMTADRSVQCNMPFSSQTGEHKWLVLTVANDFTHIFITTWNSFVLKEKVMNAMKLCMKFNKTVKISAPNIIPDLFATAKEPGKMFFGPYPKNAPPDIGLYHVYNKKLIPAHEYAQIVAKKPNAINGYRGGAKTTACWLYIIDSCTTQQSVHPSENAVITPNIDEASDDEDCMIVETPNEVIDLFDDSSNDLETNQSKSCQLVGLGTPRTSFDDDWDASPIKNTEETPSQSTSSNPPSLFRIVDVASIQPNFNASDNIPHHINSNENLNISIDFNESSMKNKPHKISIMSSMKASKSPTKPNQPKLTLADNISIQSGLNGGSIPNKSASNGSIRRVKANSLGATADIFDVEPSTSSNVNIARLSAEESSVVKEAQNSLPFPITIHTAFNRPTHRVETKSSGVFANISDMETAIASNVNIVRLSAEESSIVKEAPTPKLLADSTITIQTAHNPPIHRVEAKSSGVFDIDPPTSSNGNYVRLLSAEESPVVIETPTPKLLPGSMITINKSSVRLLPKNLIIKKITGKRNSTEVESSQEPPTKLLCASKVADAPKVLPPCVPDGSREIIKVESDDDDEMNDEPQVHTIVTEPRVSIPSQSAGCSSKNVTPGELTDGKGYLVSNCGQVLGKIRAEVCQGKILMKLEYWHKTIPFDDFAALDKHLLDKMQYFVYAFEPRDIKINWRFVPESDQTIADAAYPFYPPEIWSHAHTVLTETHLIDLLSDFEANINLPRELLLRLLVLKLAYLSRVNRFIVRTMSFSDILQTGVAQVKLQIERQVELESIKMSWAAKIHANQTKLSDLQSKRGAQPPGALSNVSSTPRSAGSRRTVPVECLPKMPSEVIEIDDDDDD